jgi:hypothetical protein
MPERQESGKTSHYRGGPTIMSNFQQHPPQRPVKKPMSREVRIAWAILAAFSILGVGAALGAAGGSDTATASTPGPQPTVTVSIPGEPGAEVTVTAPPVTITKPAPPAKTVTAAPPEAAAAISGDGTYEIGVDIKPGKYKTTGGDGCYWARLKDLEGGFDSIIANEFADGPQTVTIKKSDKGFKVSNCGDWTKVS